MPIKNKKNSHKRLIIGFFSILAIITAGSAAYFSNGVLFKGQFLSPTFQPSINITPPTVQIDKPGDQYEKYSYGNTILFQGLGMDAQGENLAGRSLSWSSSIDGSIGHGNTITRKLSKGMHTITLTVIDSNNRTASDIKYVNVINMPPEIQIKSPANNSFFDPLQPLTFEGIANDPEEGDIPDIALSWKSDRDGELGRGRSFTLTKLSGGKHKIYFTAKDTEGAETSYSVTINAKNNAPVVQITEPTDGVNDNPTITFSATAVDPEDGELYGSNFVWTSDIQGQIGTGSSFSTNTLNPGKHLILLTAKDNSGEPGYDSVTVIVTKSRSIL